MYNLIGQSEADTVGSDDVISVCLDLALCYNMYWVVKKRRYCVDTLTKHDSKIILSLLPVWLTQGKFLKAAIALELQ